jgi:transposase
VGYKVHLTETCDEELPRIITEVHTTLAPIADGAMTTPIHATLQTKDLLPADHLVDTAYLDAELLVTSQETYGVNQVGPTRMDTGWQARQVEGGFAAENFVVDWERQQATCPGGKTSQYWQPAKETRGNDTILIRFSKKIVDAVPYIPIAPAPNPQPNLYASTATATTGTLGRSSTGENGRVQKTIRTSRRN